MSERKTLAFDETISYEGLINVKAVYKILNDWFSEHGYDEREVFNMEQVYQDGKQLTIETKPYKKISDYAKIEHKIEISFDKLQEKVIERQGLKQKVMQGSASFGFYTYLITDRKGMWTGKPMYFFLRNIMERFLYRSYISRYEDEAIKDKNAVMQELRKYLNMQKLK